MDLQDSIDDLYEQINDDFDWKDDSIWNYLKR